MNGEELFVQFYERTNGALILDNGFSATWQECRRRGELLWVECVPRRPLEPPSPAELERMQSVDLPIERGTVWISAWYCQRLEQVSVWARRYPHLQLVVGGLESTWRQTLPAGLTNVRFSDRLVEQELLGRQDCSTTWDLEVPQELATPEVKVVRFVYVMERGCYWKRCRFCGDAYRTRQAVDDVGDGRSLRVPEVEGRWVDVWLGSASLTPRALRKSYPNLPARRDVRYRAFYRAGPAETRVLDEVLSRGGGPDPRLIAFTIGVEMPSNRMLAEMDKGTTVESILEAIDVMTRHGCQVELMLILGFPDLEEEDVEAAERFLGRLRGESNVVLSVGPLVLQSTSIWGERYLSTGRDRLLPLVPQAGLFRIRLDRRQEELNGRLRQLYAAFPKRTILTDLP